MRPSMAALRRPPVVLSRRTPQPRPSFDQTISSLIDRGSNTFARHVKEIWEIAESRHGAENADKLTQYIFILNSDRDFIQNGLSATNPSALFTIIIGGNIVSRGVTFENLLSMFFTRDVKHKIQQDTYIQRARMFGSRGKYLPHFELTIPDHLYADWHRCFVFHRLALAAIQKRLGSPVWLTDKRIAAVAESSIDRSTVDVDRGEMAFHLFDFDDRYDSIVNSDSETAQKLEHLTATSVWFRSSKRHAHASSARSTARWCFRTVEAHVC